MLQFKGWSATTAASLLAACSGWAAPDKRVDLVEFGRVVAMPDEPKAVTTAADELVRGTNGWDAVRGDDGVYTIGVEWDEPRELAEVNIEFRHAIADREQIKVQYWKDEPGGTEGAGTTGRKAKGRWLTPKTEWWAGDRDVSFSFLPGDHEATGGQADKTTRRTRRLRFICGKTHLPPVRYLRAYGPEPFATDTFDVRLDANSPLSPPVTVQIVNGYILSVVGNAQMTSAVMRDREMALQIRYLRGEADSPNRTRVILESMDEAGVQAVFYPAEVARRGQVRLTERRLVVERRGGKLPSAGAATTVPADN
ncbi:MAG TPA: hypothetical protein PL151_14035 [Phycisphaerae bacterium]|nr:hypothetical protein [Phycisphaerae bacterium]HOJ74906.1 hypothetical protein [Phycisphaerae bacterium]HOM51467.1 hypothetical protein [Phycisphaerae bacterium]HON69181.1 hypothetical protein [Phycisphaerae bacterium]HOQ85580.1 hypothetical protein [Phycisphaerae bacterium]